MESRRTLLVACLVASIAVSSFTAPVVATAVSSSDTEDDTDYRSELRNDSSILEGNESLLRENASVDVVGELTNGTAIGENGTNRSLRRIEDGANATIYLVDEETNETLRPVAETGVLDEPLAAAADEPVAADGENVSAGQRRPGPDVKLPGVELTERALVVELRSVSMGSTATLTLPLAVEETRDDASIADSAGSEDGDSEPNSGPESEDGNADDAVATTEPTTTPSAESENATAGGAAGDDETAQSATFGFDGTGSFDPLAALGTAAFVLVARPWVGLLSGAAGLLSDWAGRLLVAFRYGRHDGSDPLEHETRARIDELVSDSPGRTLTELAEELETPISTVRHHVRVLERERIIVTRKLRGKRRFYPLGVENEELAAALEEEATAPIIDALHEQGRATVGDIVDRVEKSYSTVSYHLSRLVEEDLVVQEREGRHTVSRLDPSVESLLETTETDHSKAEATTPEASAD